MQELPH